MGEAGIGTIGIIETIVPDETIGQDEELSRDGDDGDLGGFAAGTHGAVLGSEARIAAAGDEPRHVKRGTHAGTATADLVAPDGGPALARMWGKTGQAGD